ncbi:hypothetical protein KI387_034219 [Taxus chinensis]|uniref:EamA domain-containing protein n=1 Tax=Taxus chinensis TaxID=29808 RepID=A0AA38BWS4_TAXCH|nr:hypothetical protein KI387_034219 [Taxus chinensis]
MGSCILIQNCHSAHSWHRSFQANSEINLLHPYEKKHPNPTQFFCSKYSTQRKSLMHSTVRKTLTIQCKRNNSEMPSSPSVAKNQDPLTRSSSDMDCTGSELDVESVIPTIDDNSEEGEKLLSSSSSFEISNKQEFAGMVNVVLDTLLLISPFFFWGTAMVAMKEVLPKTGPLFVAAVRLIPAGLLLISFAQYNGKKQPSGFMSWLSLALFGLVDAACFQGFLAEGLKRTSAGLGSVIIDSQPLTVAVLAAILFGESIGTVGAAGLVLGVIGLLLLEVPTLNGTDISETVVSQSAVFQQNFTSLLGSGEWWMLLAAQSMAIGTVMVRWVCKYSDPVMATGWEYHQLSLFLPKVEESSGTSSTTMEDLIMMDEEYPWLQGPTWEILGGSKALPLEFLLGIALVVEKKLVIRVCPCGLIHLKMKCSLVSNSPPLVGCKDNISGTIGDYDDQFQRVTGESILSSGHGTSDIGDNEGDE